MAEPKFAIMDEVRLVMGGMTLNVGKVVRNEDGTLNYRCVWVENGKPRSDEFPEAMLTAAAPPAPKSKTKPMAGYG
jgi:hypothetical protein